VYTAAGHLTLASGKPDPNLDQADVTFGTLAATATPARRGPPSHDFAAGTCSNVYCHGDAFANSGATHPQPTWTGGATQGECGSCHGAPPTGSSHPADPDCARCHTDKTIAAHINGKIDLGIEAAGCSGCHGGPDSPNPLSGAHLGHTEALHALTGKISCESCHVVPATLTAAGHLDAAPAEVTLKAGGTFNGGDKSCAAVGCHGGTQVAWNAGPSAAACGSCHGIPPNNGAHFSTLTLTDCVRCHAQTVDGFGNIKIVDGMSTHINGRTDIVAP
jgi:predicted CxxxxCH...CXXCH cytochrome family protein